MRSFWAAISVVAATVVAVGVAPASDGAAAALPPSHRAQLVVKGTPPVSRSVSPDASPATTTTAYHYVYDRSLATGTGASGKYVVSDPAVPAPDLHSLAEISVESADGEQIVEEGWTVDPGQFGDTLPHLFVFHWVNGNPTCYDACGFISTNPVTQPGMPLPIGVTQAFRINFSHGRWHIWVDGQPIGYYPESLWTTSFTTTGLTQWFGEVAASASPPCAQMGNGLFPSDLAADKITKMAVVGAAPVSPSLFKTDPTLYGGKRIGSDGLRFGGPGGCGPQPQVVTFVSPAPTNASVNGKTYTPIAVGGGSGNPVVISVATTSAGICTLNDDVVSFTGPGKCEVDANQAGNAAFTNAQPASQIFRVRFEQTIAFTSVPPKHPHVGGKFYKVAATGGESGRPIRFTIGHHAQSVCRMTGKHKVTFLAAGLCSVHANQYGDPTYAPAHQVHQQFTVHRH